MQNFDPIGLQILPPVGPLGKHTFSSIFITTLPELITFSLSRSTVNIRSHVAPGEHMVPGPFHFHECSVKLQSRNHLKILFMPKKKNMFYPGEGVYLAERTEI
jgi:hypothetical protein